MYRTEFVGVSVRLSTMAQPAGPFISEMVISAGRPVSSLE
jgi:hypothetical protein